MQSDEFDDNWRPPVKKKTDASAMRILKEWCAKRDGATTNGAVIEHEFVVVEPKDESR